MRTTVALDDDVAAEVDRLRREESLGLSEALNRLARGGLVRAAERPRSTYGHHTANVGLTVDVSDIGSVLDPLRARP